jgi:hypothetical protein
VTCGCFASPDPSRSSVANRYAPSGAPAAASSSSQRRNPIVLPGALTSRDRERRTLAQLVGSVLFAVPFLRGRASPAGAGYLLVASGVLAGAGFPLAGPDGGAPGAVVTTLSPLLFAALGWLGSRLGAADRRDQPSATVA